MAPPTVPITGLYFSKISLIHHILMVFNRNRTNVEPRPFLYHISWLTKDASISADSLVIMSIDKMAFNACS